MVPRPEEVGKEEEERAVETSIVQLSVLLK